MNTFYFFLDVVILVSLNSMYFDLAMIIGLTVLTRIGNMAAAVNVGILKGQLSLLEM